MKQPDWHDMFTIKTRMHQLIKLVKHFAIIFFICYSHNTLAVTQYIAANVVYAAEGVGAFDSVEKAIAATEKRLCSGSEYMANCKIVYSGDLWVPNLSSWRWHGLYTHDTVYGNVVTHWGPDDFSGVMNLECPPGWTAGASQSLKGLCWKDQPIPHCDVCDKNNPVPAANGSMIPSGRLAQQIETDYTNASGTLQFTRTYRSDEKRWAHNYDITAVNLNKSAPSSLSTLCVKITSVYNLGKPCLPYMGTNNPNNATTNNFVVRRGMARTITFGSNTDVLPQKDVNDRVSYTPNPQGDSNGVVVYNASTDSTEYYGANDKISRSIQRNGGTTTFVYSDLLTPKEVAPDRDFLISVKDPFGRHLDFTYDLNGNMSSMMTPTGDIFKYSYNAAGILISVVNPDGSHKSYQYNESSKTQNTAQPLALTSIKDSSDNIIGGFYYDATGKITSNESGVDAGKNTISSYSDNYVEITGPLGAVKAFRYKEILGMTKISSVRQSDPTGASYVFTTFDYDANGNISGVTGFDGTRTTYVYDLTRNLETSRIEGVGTAFARTITTEWDPLMPLPTRVAEPKRLTTNTYDQSGNLLKKSVQATTDPSGALGFSAVPTGAPSIFNYTYNDHGEMLTQSGPRTDLSDTTTYTYDEEQNLTSIIDALGHKTVFSNYDASGHVGRVEDPNGLVSEFTYTYRGLLNSSTVGGRTTSFSYDILDNVTGVTLPDGSTVTYVYDASHRLTGVSDSVGNSIAYTLDAMGNRLSEQIRDPAGTLTRQISRVYGSLGRLKQQTGGTL